MNLRVGAIRGIVALVAGAMVATVAVDRAEASRTPAAVQKIIGTWKIKSSVRMSTCPGIRPGTSSDISIRITAHGHRVTGWVNGRVAYRGLAQRRVPVRVKLYTRRGNDAIELRAYRNRLSGSRLQVVRRGRKSCAVQSSVWSTGSVVREAVSKNPDVVSDAKLAQLRGGAPGLTAAMMKTQIQRRRYLSGIESCHEEVLTKRPRTRGTIRFAFTVSRRGRVTAVKAKGINASVAYCVETAMRGWWFRGGLAKPAKVRGAIRVKPVDLARKMAGLSKRGCRCKSVGCARGVLKMFADFVRENKHKKVSAKTSRAAGQHSKTLMKCLTGAGLSSSEVTRALIRASR
jgi:hypothetical protein